MELGGQLPHSQKATTCPYPSQINPFLCPSQVWQAQLVSFLVGLKIVSTLVIVLVHLLLLCLRFRNSSVLANLRHYLLLERRRWHSYVQYIYIYIYIWKPRNAMIISLIILETDNTSLILSPSLSDWVLWELTLTSPTARWTLRVSKMMDPFSYPRVKARATFTSRRLSL